MPERKSFLMRVDPALLVALQRWANDDLRSLNGQIEFVLRRALEREGRGTTPPTDPAGTQGPLPAAGGPPGAPPAEG
jgi:hypothetical protein